MSDPIEVRDQNNHTQVAAEKSQGKPQMQYYRTLNPYEEEFGYSRAIRKGNLVFVSGTTSIDPATGVLLHPSSAYLQSVQIFEEITRALEGVGSGKGDVVRLKLFVRDESDGGEVGRAMKEMFGDVKPAATMILGVGFVDPEMRVEIEADAVVG